MLQCGAAAPVQTERRILAAQTCRSAEARDAAPQSFEADIPDNQASLQSGEEILRIHPRLMVSELLGCQSRVEKWFPSASASAASCFARTTELKYGAVPGESLNEVHLITIPMIPEVVSRRGAAAPGAGRHANNLPERIFPPIRSLQNRANFQPR